MAKLWSDQTRNSHPQINDQVNFVAPEHPYLFRSILEQFKTLFREGKIKPGDKLLPERELSVQFKVSRPMLRESLRAMDLLGLIKIIPQQGTYVQSPNPHALSDFFSLTLSLKPSISEDITGLRVILECGAARLAAKQATREEMANMRNVLDRLPRTIKGDDLGIQADFDFHNAIIKATHSDILMFVYEAIADLLKQSHRERRIALCKVPGMLENLVSLHEAVLSAIISHDEQKADDKMKEHFVNIQNAR